MQRAIQNWCSSNLSWSVSLSSHPFHFLVIRFTLELDYSLISIDALDRGERDEFNALLRIVVSFFLHDPFHFPAIRFVFNSSVSFLNLTILRFRQAHHIEHTKRISTRCRNAGFASFPVIRFKVMTKDTSSVSLSNMTIF